MQEHVPNQQAGLPNTQESLKLAQSAFVPAKFSRLYWVGVDGAST